MDAIDPVSPLAPALGYGNRGSHRGCGIAWIGGELLGLDLDSELVWIGDEGHDGSGWTTRRLGFGVRGRARLTSWLFFDPTIRR